MLETSSLISTSSSRISFNVIDNLIDILNNVCPDQVFVTILGFLIEQLRGLKLGFELCSIFSCSKSGGKFFNLCLTFGEVLYKPDECFVSVGHGL